MEGIADVSIDIEPLNRDQPPPIIATGPPVIDNQENAEDRTERKNEFGHEVVNSYGN